MTNFLGGVLFINGNLTLKILNNLRVKQLILTAGVHLCSTKVMFGDHMGQTGGITPWPSFRTSPGWGELRLCC